MSSTPRTAEQGTLLAEVLLPLERVRARQRRADSRDDLVGMCRALADRVVARVGGQFRQSDQLAKRCQKCGVFAER